jgi:hypothetical protein
LQLNKLQASGTLPTFFLPNGENAPPSLGYADDDNYILIGELSELALRIKRLFEEGAKLGLTEQSTTKTFPLCLSDGADSVTHLQLGGDTTTNSPPFYPQLPEAKNRDCGIWVSHSFVFMKKLQTGFLQSSKGDATRETGMEKRTTE